MRLKIKMRRLLQANLALMAVFALYAPMAKAMSHDCDTVRSQESTSRVEGTMISQGCEVFGGQVQTCTYEYNDHGWISTYEYVSNCWEDFIFGWVCEEESCHSSIQPPAH